MVTFSVGLLSILTPACKKDTKKDPEVQKNDDVVITLPPGEACKAQPNLFATVQKSLCSNSASRTCLDFQEFLKGKTPVFSSKEQYFVIGTEVAVPIEGQPMIPDDDQDYLILVVEKKKDQPLTLALTDVRALDQDENKAMKNYLQYGLSTNDPTAVTIQDILSKKLETQYLPPTPPQSCTDWVYFPLPSAQDRPSDVIVRQSGSKYYVLALIYSSKRDKILSAYFSAMVEPLPAPPQTSTATVNPPAGSPTAGGPAAATTPAGTNPSATSSSTPTGTVSAAQSGVTTTDATTRPAPTGQDQKPVVPKKPIRKPKKKK